MEDTGPTFAVSPKPRAFPEYDPFFTNPAAPLPGRYRTREQRNDALIALDSERPTLREGFEIALGGDTFGGAVLPLRGL